MPTSFADLLRLLKPDAGLLRRPTATDNAASAPAATGSSEARLSILGRIGATLSRGRPAANAAEEDVAMRRLAAMARAEHARAERATTVRMGHARLA